MEGFDDPGVFFSDNFSETQDDRNTNRVAVKKKFLKFIKEFQEGDNVLVFKYRDALKKSYNRFEYKLEVNMEDLKGFDEQLCEKLKQEPAEMLALFEEAAKEAADQITKPRPVGEEKVEDIHITLTSGDGTTSLRDLKSEQVS